MAPTFRSSRSGRQFENTSRSRTGQIDHDVFEGLPVRRWTRQRQTITQQPKPSAQKSILQGPDGKHLLPELPMPRDSELLTPASRALLRAARAGCIYIRHAPKEPQEEIKEPIADGEESHGVRTDRSFVALKWTPAPRHLELPEIEFLAKRRPGLSSLYGGAAAGVAENGVVSMRRTRFKKVDPTTGNISIYDAWVPEGLRIEGETTEDTQTIIAANSGVSVTPVVAPPGTVVEGVGVVNSEGLVVAEAGSDLVQSSLKRRPPPPKRKGKGIGRGRKKKVMFAPGEGEDASMVHSGEPGSPGGAAENGIGKGGAGASRQDEEEEEEEEEGDEGEESDDGDEPMADTKTPETPGQQGAEPTSNVKPEPTAEPEPVSNGTAEVPTTEGPSQPTPPEVSSQAPSDMPPAASEEKKSDEKAATEDVDMTDAGQVSETPQVQEATATTQESVSQPSPKEAPQSELVTEPVVQEGVSGEPTEKPSEIAAESEPAQSQSPNQSAMPTAVTAEITNIDARNGDTAPETTADVDRPIQQVEEQPVTQQAENEFKEDNEDQTGEHIDEPTEQAIPQATQSETKLDQPEESRHPDQQQQQITEPSTKHQATQPPDQAQSQAEISPEKSTEEQPTGEQAIKQEASTPLPLQQKTDTAPTAIAEDRLKSDEPPAGHEDKKEDVKEEGEGEPALSG